MSSVSYILLLFRFISARECCYCVLCAAFNASTKFKHPLLKKPHSSSTLLGIFDFSVYITSGMLLFAGSGRVLI